MALCILPECQLGDNCYDSPELQLSMVLDKQMTGIFLFCLWGGLYNFHSLAVKTLLEQQMSYQNFTKNIKIHRKDKNKHLFTSIIEIIVVFSQAKHQ